MLLIALLGAPVPLGLMVWFVIVAPEFTKAFADFGGVLPWVTRLVLAPWWAPTLILLYVCALPATFGFRKNVHRDFALIGVVLVGLLAVMASSACLYLPLFQVSQAMR